MSEKEKNTGQSADQARIRPPVPKEKVDPEVWNTGSSARSASDALRPQGRSANDSTASGRTGRAPDFREARGGARARARPAPAARQPPATKPPRARPDAEPAAPSKKTGRGAPPSLRLRPQAAEKAPPALTRGSPAWARRAPGTAAARTGRPQSLFSGENSTRVAGQSASGRPAWAGHGAIGPTAGAAGWGEPSAAGGIGIARPGDGPAPRAATWWDGQSWWSRSDAESKPSAASWFDGKSWWTATETKKAETGPAAWAKGEPAQAAWSRSVEHTGPPVWMQKGAALAAVFRPVKKIIRARAVWAKGEPAQAAWSKPVEHNGPPVWMQPGPSVAAVFRPVERKPAPRPFWLRSASEGPWIFTGSGESGLWILKKNAQKAAVTSSDLAPQARPTAPKPWTINSFVAKQTDTALQSPSSSPVRAYPYLQAGDRSSTTDSSASARGYPHIGRNPAPSWRDASSDLTQSGEGGEAPPLPHSGLPPAQDPPGGAYVLPSQSKTSEQELLYKGRATTPERLPPSPWYGALGYAMQFTIIDALMGDTQLAGNYIANNSPLQRLAAELAPLHEGNPYEYPNMQDITDIMAFTAKHVARFYDSQRKTLGFDNTTLFYEVGILHNYKQYNEARTRLNARLEEGSLLPETIVYLTDPRSRVTEAAWKSIGDRRLRQDLQIVTQPSTVYSDRRPNGEWYYYIATDGVRPDIIRVLTNNGPQGDDMPYLLSALAQIVKGPGIRRNLQDFQRWINEPVAYKGGKITALEAFDLFCKRLAVGDAHVIIDEVKTHTSGFSRVHSKIEYALGHIPDPGSNLRDTNLSADISVTTRSLLHFVKNVLGYNGNMIAGIAENTQAQFSEVSMSMIHPETMDPIHAEASDLLIPVPRFRAYSVKARELAYGWMKRRERIIETGRTETNGPVTILPYDP